MAESRVERVTRETERDLALLSKDVEGMRQDFDIANLNQVRERLAIVEERVTELRKAREEAEKRHWQFVLLFLGGLVTLGINLVVSFVRK